MASIDGVTRSRTLLFLSYRDSSTRSFPPRRLLGRSSRRILDADDTAEEELALLEDERLHFREEPTQVSLPPAWVDLSERVELILASTKPKAHRLEKLHAKHLLPGFKDRTAEERAIQQLSSDITNDFRTCHKLIKQISTVHLRKAEGRPDAQFTRNVQIALATKLQAISSAFRKEQSVYLRQLSGSETKSATKATEPSHNASFELDEDMQLTRASIDNLNHSQLANQIQTQTATSKNANQRIEEINTLADSITQLADLFKDLSSLVIDQGTLLDRVDYNVEQLATHMEGALIELQKATKHQKRSGKLGCLFLLLLLVFAATGMLLYKLSAK